MVENREHYIEEDEIDLRELFVTIWQGKWKIATFTTLIVTFTILHTISIPNSYKSEIALSPSEQGSSSSMGGLSALAGFAGVNIGNSGSGVDTVSSLQTILSDYTFISDVAERYKLKERFKNSYRNYIYPVGLKDSVLYDNKISFEDMDLEKENYTFYKLIIESIQLSQDKKSSVITLSAETNDRFLSKELVDIFLKELVERLRSLEMRDIQKKVDFYEQKLQHSNSVELKEQIGKIVSGLIQKQVLAEANELYTVSKLTESRVPTVIEKSKPKRALIVVVSFVTSIIIGIFGLFFMEFLRGNESSNKDEIK